MWLCVAVRRVYGCCFLFHLVSVTLLSNVPQFNWQTASGFFPPFLRFCIAFALRCQQTFCSELFGSHFYGKTFNANTQTCVCGWIKCVSENWLANWNISAQQIVECDENERGKKYEMENFLIAAKPNTNRKENIIRCVNLMCCFVVDFGLVEFAFTN